MNVEVLYFNWFDPRHKLAYEILNNYDILSTAKKLWDTYDHNI